MPPTTKRRKSSSGSKRQQNTDGHDARLFEMLSSHEDLVASLTKMKSILEAGKEDGTGKDDDIIVTKHSVPLDRLSLKRLIPGNWFNDNIVNVFFSLLNDDKSVLSQGRSKAKALFFQTHFLTRLLDEENNNKKKEGNLDHEAVKKWKPTQNVDGDWDMMFFPVNEVGHHWFLIVANFKQKAFQVHDSIIDSNRRERIWKKHVLAVKEFLKHFREMSVSDWKEELPSKKKQPVQSNGEFSFMLFSFAQPGWMIFATFHLNFTNFFVVGGLIFLQAMIVASLSA